MRRDAIAAAVVLGDTAAASKVEDAAYLIGSTYAAMLPREVRAKGGIDPFAAWMSRTFLAATLHTLLDGAECEIDDVVTECNSLLRTKLEDFDLVVGNPPYGRITLDALAIRNTKPRGGVIAG